MQRHSANRILFHTHINDFVQSPGAWTHSIASNLVCVFFSENIIILFELQSKENEWKIFDL